MFLFSPLINQSGKGMLSQFPAPPPLTPVTSRLVQVGGAAVFRGLGSRCCITLQYSSPLTPTTRGQCWGWGEGPNPPGLNPRRNASIVDIKLIHPHRVRIKQTTGIRL